MSLTDIVITLGYDPEQTGALLNIVRQNFLQLKSFQQLPDDRLEKMELLIAVIYPVRHKLSTGTESPAAPLQTPRKQKPAATQREVPRRKFELRSLRPSKLMCVNRLRLKTLERSQEVSSQK